MARGAMGDEIFALGFGGGVGGGAAEETALIGAGLPLQIARGLRWRRGFIFAGDVGQSPGGPELIEGQGEHLND